MSLIQNHIISHMISHPYDIRLLPADFPGEFLENEFARGIFYAVSDLHRKQMLIDKSTVCEWASMFSTAKKTATEYEKYLDEISGMEITSQAFQFYVRVFVASYAKKKIQQIGSAITAEQAFTGNDIESVLEETINSLRKVRELISISESDEKPEPNLYYRLLHEIGQPKEKKRLPGGISSGFTELDELTGGFFPGEITIVGARPGMGKTAFLVSILSHLHCASDLATAYFSMDIAPDRLMMKLIANASAIGEDELRKREFNGAAFSRLHDATEFLSDAKLHIESPSRFTLHDVMNACERLVTEKNVKMFFIDYLQLIAVRDSRFRTRDAELSHIMRSLKNFARKRKVSFIIASQLSRDVERRSTASKRPALSDLRDSGSIEQDAAKVLFIYRPEYYGITEDELGNSTTGKAKIIVAKNKNGACDEVTLDFVGRCSKFSDPEKGVSFLDVRNTDFPF